MVLVCSASICEAQIFNHSELKEKLKDKFNRPGTMIRGQRDIHYFLLMDDAFVLKLWLMKSFSRRTLTSNKWICDCRIFSSKRVVENAFRILANSFINETTMQQYPEVATKYPPQVWYTGVINVRIH